MENQIAIIDLSSKILVLRDQCVMLDADVAEVYGVETRDINKAVKNNPDKFPEGYVIPLDNSEKKELVENFHRFDRLKHSTVAPKAFTERGLYMLATILKSPIATRATLSIIETYAQVKELRNELISMHNEKDKAKQHERMNKFGEILSEIVMPDLRTDETETSLEINFLVGKIKHTVKRRRRDGHDEVEQE